MMQIKRVEGFYFGTARSYLPRMDHVERRRDRMIERLAKWSGLTTDQIAQRIADFIDPGRTFDETLYATYHFHAYDRDPDLESL